MAVYKNRYFLPVIFILLNVIGKSIYLVAEDICLDEPFTIYHAQFDIVNLVHYLKNYNNPPLYEIILHFWIKCFGISAVSVRILPMLFSSLTVFFIYQLCISFFDKRTAIVASLLYTLSTMNNWFAHDCRVYPLVVLLTVVSFYLFFKLLKEPRLFNWFYVFIFSIVNLLLVYAHYFGFLVWGLEFLIVCLFYLRSKEILKKFGITYALAVIAYLPQVVVLFSRTKTSVSNGTWIEAPKGLESIYNMLWSFCNEPVPTIVCCLVLISTCVIFFTRKDKNNNPFTKYIIIWFVVPFFLLFFISYKILVFIDRYLLFISPAFYILLALSVSFVFTKPRFYMAGTSVLIILFFLTVELNPRKKRDVANAVEWIKSRKDNNTLVLGCSYDFILNFAYYYNTDFFKIKDQRFEYNGLEQALETDNIYFIHKLSDNLLIKLKKFDRVVYLDAAADFSSPDNKIKQQLYEKNIFIERTYFYNHFFIYNFKVNKN